jgi:hypothetical protein
MGMKAKKELNERNLNQHIEADKSTTKDLDLKQTSIKA